MGTSKRKKGKRSAKADGLGESGRLANADRLAKLGGSPKTGPEGEESRGHAEVTDKKSGSQAASNTAKDEAGRSKFGRPDRIGIAAWALIVLLVGLLAVNTVTAIRHADMLRPVHAGQVAPDFELPSLKGNRVRLSSLRGRAVLMMFWSIYCGVCHKELPVLEKLRATYGASGLTVLGIHINQGSAPASKVRETVQEMGLSMPVLLDRGYVSNLYKVRQFPQMVLLDRSGRVIGVWVGRTSASTMAGPIKRALAQHH